MDEVEVLLIENSLTDLITPDFVVALDSGAAWPSLRPVTALTNEELRTVFDDGYVTPDESIDGRLLRFPDKLVRAVQNHSHVLRWDPVACAIVLLDPKAFEEEVFPAFFGGKSSLKSFHRQLNYYGFEVRKCSQGRKVYINRDPTVTCLADFKRLVRRRPKPKPAVIFHILPSPLL